MKKKWIIINDKEQKLQNRLIVFKIFQRQCTKNKSMYFNCDILGKQLAHSCFDCYCDILYDNAARYTVCSIG